MELNPFIWTLSPLLSFECYSTTYHKVGLEGQIKKQFTLSSSLGDSEIRCITFTFKRNHNFPEVSYYWGLALHYNLPTEAPWLCPLEMIPAQQACI